MFSIWELINLGFVDGSTSSLYVDHAAFRLLSTGGSIASINPDLNFAGHIRTSVTTQHDMRRVEEFTSDAQPRSPSPAVISNPLMGYPL